MTIIHSTNASFGDDVKEKKGIVLVDFYADWCGPCQMVGPIFEDLSKVKEYKDKVIFVKVNVDNNQDIAQQYNVMSIPTFIIFKDGKPVHQFTGAKNKEGFKNEINKYI